MSVAELNALHRELRAIERGVLLRELVGEVLDLRAALVARCREIDALEDDKKRVVAENRELRRQLAHPAPRIGNARASLPAKEASIDAPGANSFHRPAAITARSTPTGGGALRSVNDGSAPAVAAGDLSVSRDTRSANGSGVLGRCPDQTVPAAPDPAPGSAPSPR